ncbi:MAG: sugar phosphate nucleotidyltransferase [Oscillospiraceae bacterium]
MQAIIMAGGEGTRLRPLTCGIPKPLAPLCGRPVLEYILELLKSHRFNQATLTLMYQGDRIVSHFDDDSFEGMALDYSFEDFPLGTAGCVRLASKEDEALVISGDAMCDFDLTTAIDFHKKNNADATIVVKRVADPREFGLVLFDEQGRITGFAEKPSFESCTTDMANTGVYILSKSVLELIPENKKCDFAQDIFPLMLKKNMRLFAFEEAGYWCDIGDFKSYIKCQRDMLEGKVSCRLSGHRRLDGTITADSGSFRGVKLVPPCYIGKNVSIGEGSIIEAGSVLCDNVTVGGKTKIHGAVILDGAFLGDRVSCVEAVVCESARLLRGSSVFEEAVIGEGAVIGENSVVEAGVRIWQGKQLERGVCASYDVKYGNAKAIFLDEEGLAGETNGDITPQLAAALGAAASCCQGGSVSVGYKNEKSAKALAFAFISGAMSAGRSVLDFGECTEPSLAFCMKAAESEIGCFIDGGNTVRLKILSENGLSPTRAQERKIEAGLNRSEYRRAAFNEFGEYKRASDILELYEANIRKILPPDLNGIRAEFKTTSMKIAELIDRTITPLVDIDGERIVVHISGDGKKASPYSDETGYIFYEKMVLLGCKIVFEQGRDVALPFSFPAAADELAKKYNRRVLRYFNCTCDKSDSEARRLAADSAFVNDGVLLSAMALSYIRSMSISFKKAVENIPQFFSTTRFVSMETPPAQLLKKFCTEKAGLGEGVILNEAKGRVLIRPSKAGKGVMMFVESLKSETASELCDKFEGILKRGE